MKLRQTLAGRGSVPSPRLRSELRALPIVALALAFPVAPSGAADNKESPLVPEVSMAVRHDVSPPFRLIKAKPVRPAKDRQVPIRIPLDLAQRHKPSPEVDDPVRQWESLPTSATPSPLLSFEGSSDDDNAAVIGGRVVPPDTNGDVGPNHYVQTINSVYAVYNKTGTRIFGPVAINALWSGFGGICEANNDGDPTVLYDHLADRWVISQFAIGSDGHQCVAVSTTGDPTGSYNRYDFNVSPGKFNDYPKMGVWPDGYYIMANQFAGSFEGVIAVAFERDKMLTGASAQQVKFGPLPCGTECYFSVLPSDLDGAAPAAGTPNTFIQAWDDESWGSGANSDGYRIWDFSVNWTNAGSSTFTNQGQVDTPEFDANLCNFNACVSQPRPGEKLDTLSQFTMYRAQYRKFATHEALIVSHTVDAKRNLAGVRWTELRRVSGGGGWTLYQTGTISPNSDHRWMGSANIDKAGNIAVGYSVSSRNVFPSIRYATRNASDPLGTMGSEVTLIAGTGAQSSSYNRWGDYSSMSVDPVDGCTFWFTTEYYANNGSFDFKTRIGAFKVPGCV